MGESDDDVLRHMADTMEQQALEDLRSRDAARAAADEQFAKAQSDAERGDAILEQLLVIQQDIGPATDAALARRMRESLPDSLG